MALSGERHPAPVEMAATSADPRGARITEAHGPHRQGILAERRHSVTSGNPVCEVGRFRADGGGLSVSGTRFRGRWQHK